jgi:hypothetical protein
MARIAWTTGLALAGLALATSCGDADTDAGAGTDADGGTGFSDCASSAGRYDPVADLCWQDPPPVEPSTWDDASAYCAGLELGSLSDWRLPRIQELVSLMRGCVDGQPAGVLDRSTCRVADPGCLDEACDDHLDCGCCTTAQGPDEDPAGCYWDPDLDGKCSTYWSSSPAGGTTGVWALDFESAFLMAGYAKEEGAYARCVRSGH